MLVINDFMELLNEVIVYDVIIIIRLLIFNFPFLNFFPVIYVPLNMVVLMDPL